jgi:hypothetical protein
MMLGVKNTLIDAAARFRAAGADDREVAERLKCLACMAGRHHTSEDEKNHPFSGHGFTKELGWSHPKLEEGMALCIFCQERLSVCGGTCLSRRAHGLDAEFSK